MRENPTLIMFLLMWVCIIVAGVSMAFLKWEAKRNKARGVTPRAIDIVQDNVASDNKSIASSSNAVAIGDIAEIVPLVHVLQNINNQPDTVPHLAATGSTGTGKTTFITAVLAARDGKVAIITPKPDDDWGGVPFVTIDDDLLFTSITRAAKAIDKEIKTRWVAVKQAKRDGLQYTPEWLTVVIDDYPFLRKQIDGLTDTVLNVARMGRSMRVRLILLAQETSVKAWGFEGEGEARENFVFVDLQEAHWLNKSATMYRWSKPPQRIDTSNVYALSQRAIHPSRWFELSNVSTFQAGGMNIPVSPDVPFSAGIPDDDTGIPVSQATADVSDDVIKALHSAGWSMNKIAFELKLTGSKQQRLQRIKDALEMQEVA